VVIPSNKNQPIRYQVIYAAITHRIYRTPNEDHWGY